ncbi:PVC-type heme-binding CxxCH protein [Fimbriiglobus ruber]|uniref:Azurin n=1 Tax=Fimbriiglobus ruber TaxID=1908690 RepID=A0A225DKN0_9BACT|nr:PVC-type heme-binding CxxCH protein [Fimbriiglobus ruber]OWK38016.1 Azurin [Fimbriiglobus ruber]
MRLGSFWLSALVGLAAASPAFAADPPPLKVLFLGDTGHHQPAARFRQLQPVMAARGITLTYTDKLDDLNPETLNKYDGLAIYANHTKFTDPAQEKALLDYVASGKGFIPLHCASYCFIDSKPYVDLVGAQFRSHTTGTFRTHIETRDHPITRGYGGFESWDETYVHTKHNTKDRTVLETRVEGDVKEPWSWVRTQGKGRVFYTAWGHDQRTWSHPGFQVLVERGIRWACGQDLTEVPTYTDRPQMTAKRTDVKPFEYQEAQIPFYSPKANRGGADRINQMQKPLPVEESIKHYITPKDFEVKTFVTEDQLGGKPLAMAWDERGRLWVSLTLDYPNELKPQGEGRDRIVCCEDSDGDGVCDKVTLFADKLSIPTSILPYAGGLIVHQAPHTLFLKDTDGDGKADVRDILFTGWGTGDTHAGPSYLRYGLDNWVYGSLGYSGFVGEVGGERHNFRMGYYRFKVEHDKTVPGGLKVTKLEFLRSTSNNTWGFGLTEDGLAFGSTANGCPIVHMPIPNRYYEKVRGLTPGVLQNIAPDYHFEPVTDKVRQVDWHGGFTAAAGCTVYTARTYPQEYWNRTAFITEPTGHLVATFVLNRAGADYTAKLGWNLLASDDEWAAPIQAEVGPDGNMWVLDWYNFIVQHNPTPAGFRTGRRGAYETPLRDKTHGRIYRVVYTKSKGEKPAALASATPAQLVEALKHPNMTWRQHAQRLLLDRNQQDVAPALAALVKDESVDAAGLNAGALHALWTLDGLGAIGQYPAEVKAALKHKSAAVRRAAVQLVAHAGGDAGVNALLESGALADADVQVRLAALLAIADAKPSAECGKAVAEALAKVEGADDKVYGEALTAAAAAQDVYFLAAAGSHTYAPRGLAVVQMVAKHYASGKSAGSLNEVLTTLATAKPDVTEAILNGFSAGWPDGKKAALTADGEKAVATLLTKAPAAARGRVLRLAGVWGVKGLDAQMAEIAKGLLTIVADAKADDTARVDAAKQVVEFAGGDDTTAAKLLDAVTAQASPQFAAGVFDALAGAKAKNLGPAVVAKLGSLPPAARPAALRLVLARPEPTAAFLDAVEAGKLRFDMLDLDQKTALAAHPNKAVSERAKKLLSLGGGLPDADRQKVIEQLASSIKKTGDPANGKKLFTQHCAKCHRHSGEGQQIGPDLTGMAVHPKEELAIAILDPSRSVEGNYKAYTLKALDGRVLTGLLAAESKTAVELLDAENKRHAVRRDDIDELTESKKSLMPEGFEKQMKPDEVADLLEFLTQKGKYVSIPLDKVATVVSTLGMFFEPDGDVERLILRDWAPRTVNSVPFYLVDPQGARIKNMVLLYGPQGKVPPKMPKSVTVPCNTAAKAIHLLSGVGGWNALQPSKDGSGSVSMIVRLHYADGTTEDHPLKNGVHFADYIHRVDVPGSKFAFAMRGQQMRYLAVTPKKPDVIKQIEFVKGPDSSAPVVMAVTVETP